ncbi:2-C-methyl-D-erythritol 4-phosphate cytidylyltransferase [Klebsiella pneumoniae]|nr:2-C-methyl-D-erythritol 4-phosphate cytidylyltransferase [Klebsiella pneumoniae]
MAATFPGVCAVVPAAGFGRRMQTECPKQYLSIGNKTILEHAVAALLADARVQRVVIAVSPGDRRFSQLPLAQHPQITVVDGGAERADSVLAGLQALPEAQWVLVHDARAPLPASGRPQPPAVALRNQPRRRDPCGASARHHEARRAGQNCYRPYRRPQ